MIPTSFAESNLVLNPPPEMTLDGCGVLSVLRAVDQHENPVVISCWKLTEQELETIKKTGRVWLTVCGETMPPVDLRVERPF